MRRDCHTQPVAAALPRKEVVAVKNVYLQTSGDFDKLDPVFRLGAREELLAFLDRHRHQFREMGLHAYLKMLNASMGSNVLVRCSLNLFTNHGKFHVVEEGFGIEAAVKSALLALRYQVEKHVDMRIDSREKAEGRKAMGLEA